MKQKTMQPKIIYRDDIIEIINRMAKDRTAYTSGLDLYVYKQFEKLCDQVGSYVNREYTPIETLIKYIDTAKPTSIRALNCLRNDRIKYMEELVEKNVNDLFKTPNFGIKSLLVLKDAWLKSGHKIKEDPKRVFKNGYDRMNYFTFEW